MATPITVKTTEYAHSPHFPITETFIVSRRRSTKGISGERKTAFYVGTLIMAVGLILFLSTFLLIGGAMTGGSIPGNIGQAFVFRGFGGFVLVVIGGTIRRLGARGLAGSGVVLDPERARTDLKPYSRMAGGMVQDALDETDVQLGGKPERVIMIKCRECSHLNEEDSKFCQECGKPM